jgi:hypothetical protein
MIVNRRCLGLPVAAHQLPAKRLDSEPVASLAVLRSMLTNASAADRYRAAAGPQLDQITATDPGRHPDSAGE